MIEALLIVVLAAAPSSDTDDRARAALQHAVTRMLPKDYAALRARAIAEDRALFVWVGLRRPEIEAARIDALHLHCDQFPEASPPCVIVARPYGADLWRVVDLPAREVESLRPRMPPTRICTPSGCQYFRAPNY